MFIGLGEVLLTRTGSAPAESCLVLQKEKQKLQSNRARLLVYVVDDFQLLSHQTVAQHFLKHIEL